MTLFDSYSNDGVSAAIGVQHTNGISLGELVTLFDSYSNYVLPWFEVAMVKVSMVEVTIV